MRKIRMIAVILLISVFMLGMQVHAQNKSSKERTPVKHERIDPQATFLRKNKQKKGVVTLPSGLQYKIITKGHGKIPTASSIVKIRYTGRLIDGTVFDRTSKPLTCAIDQLLPGCTEALRRMPVGSKWELYIPHDLGYGGKERNKIPAYSTLIFEMELIAIEKGWK